MDFFNVVTVEEGRQMLLDNFKDFQLETERVHILDSVDRTLAEDIVSSIDVPDFDRSTVDGYGIVVEDSHGATEAIPSILDIRGEIRMGELSDMKISSGQTVYIPTGAMVPKGATGVIMIENTEKMGEDSLLLYKPVSKGENIVYAGDDIKKGSPALEKGRIINAEVVGTLAALGIPQVTVYKMPRFYIISTGDEIIDIDEELAPGKIRDINSYALQVMAEKAGGKVVHRSIIKDNYELLREEVKKALEIADIVLISGGSSVGTRDYTDKVIKSFEGKGVLAHGLSIKPGKPTIIGDCEGKMVIGLPGHPVSSIVVFKALIEDYLDKKLGNKKIQPYVTATMDYNFPSSPGRETYQMVALRKEGGEYFASPTHGKSGMISLLSQSQGYMIFKSHEEGVNKGEKREIFLF